MISAIFFHKGFFCKIYKPIFWNLVCSHFFMKLNIIFRKLLRRENCFCYFTTFMVISCPGLTTLQSCWYNIPALFYSVLSHPSQKFPNINFLSSPVLKSKFPTPPPTPYLFDDLWCLLQYTREYCGLFAGAGLMPKRRLGQFMVSPEAAIQPGTPLYANHFKVGDVVDVRGLT